jgi:hypothetical protein
MREMTAEFLPARPDVDARDLASCQQRNGAYLILRVILGDAPAVTIIELEDFSAAPLAEVEQRQMPPNVREHERVQTGPGFRRFLQKPRSLVDLSARQEYMRQRMLRPRLLAPHLECCSCRRFRLVQ